jgi:hypothetical protein
MELTALYEHCDNMALALHGSAVDGAEDERAAARRAMRDSGVRPVRGPASSGASVEAGPAAEAAAERFFRDSARLQRLQRQLRQSREAVAASGLRDHPANLGNTPYTGAAAAGGTQSGGRGPFAGRPRGRVPATGHSSSASSGLEPPASPVHTAAVARGPAGLPSRGSRTGGGSHVGVLRGIRAPPRGSTSVPAQRNVSAGTPAADNLSDNEVAERFGFAALSEAAVHRMSAAQLRDALFAARATLTAAGRSEMLLRRQLEEGSRKMRALRVSYNAQKRTIEKLNEGSIIRRASGGERKRVGRRSGGSVGEPTTSTAARVGRARPLSAARVRAKPQRPMSAY